MLSIGNFLVQLHYWKAARILFSKTSNICRYLWWAIWWAKKAESHHNSLLSDRDLNLEFYNNMRDSERS